MSSFAGPGNPILYAQFQSRGGWRRLAVAVGIYVLLVGSLIALTTYESKPRDRDDMLTRWLGILLGLQVLATMFFGTVRISSAVRADFKDQMMESHRLMPLPRVAAVIGYLLGAAAQPIGLGVATLVMGLIVCPLSHTVDPQRWITANFMLGAFTLMLWAISAQIAFSVRGGVLILVVASFLLLANEGSASALLPGVALLTYPMVGHPVFELDSRFIDVQAAYGLSLIAQAAVTGICLAAAARKFRSRDGVGLNAGLGLLLLLVSVGASMVAYCNPDVFTWGWRRLNSPEEQMPFIASVAASLLLTLVPLASSARNNSRGSEDVRSREWPTWSVSMMCTAVIALLLSAAPTTHPLAWKRTAQEYTLATVAVAVCSFAGLFRWAYRYTRRIWWIGSLWLAVVWVAPLAVQAIHDVRADEQAQPTWFYTGSPVGALTEVWTHDPTQAAAGIAYQAVWMLLPLALVGRTLLQRRQQKSPAAELGSTAEPLLAN